MKVVDRLPAITPNERTFAELYEQACARAVRHAERFVDSDAAWDAVQQAALELFRRWDRTPLEQRTVPYFMGAVHKQVLRLLHRDHGRVSWDDDLLAPHTLPSGGQRSDVTEQFDVELIDQLVDALPLRCREVWLLFRDHGLSYAEIAEAMDLSVVTVRRHMARTIQLFRERLAGMAGTHAATLGAPGRILPGIRRESDD